MKQRVGVVLCIKGASSYRGMQSFSLPNEHRNTCLIILSPYWALNNFKQLCCPREKSCGAVEPWGIPSALGPQWGHWGQGQQLWGSLAHPLLLISLLSLWALLTAPPLFSYIQFLLEHWNWWQHCTASRFGLGCQQTFPSITCLMSSQFSATRSYFY